MSDSAAGLPPETSPNIRIHHRYRWMASHARLTQQHIPYKQMPLADGSPAFGKAGQTMTLVAARASARVSATGPILPACVESNVERYLSVICLHPCARSHYKAPRLSRTAISGAIERVFSDTTPAPVPLAAADTGIPGYCAVPSPPSSPSPFARVFAMSPPPAKSSAIAPISID